MTTKQPTTEQIDDLVKAIVDSLDISDIADIAIIGNLDISDLVETTKDAIYTDMSKLSAEELVEEMKYYGIS